MDDFHVQVVRLQAPAGSSPSSSLLLSHCVPCCGCFRARAQSEQNQFLEKQHFWVQSEQNPWKTAFLGAKGTEPLEKTAFLGAELTKSLGRVWIGMLVRYTIQVKFPRELCSYAVTVGKFSGINFINSYSFRRKDF